MLWKVHGFFMLGRGSAYHVQAHPNYLAAGNAFLSHLRRQNPTAGWEFLKVHTHCRGTGREWFHRFSSQDLQAVAGEVAENPKFTLMMYRPIHHIATGHARNRCAVTVVKSTPRHRESSDNLKKVYARIVREQGIKLPRIRATTRSRRI